VLGQLGNRVQHALRAFTPRDQKAVQTAASTLRANPQLDTQQAITELAVGEALVSFLDERGTPSVVERAWILPPGSRIGPVDTTEREAVIKQSLVAEHYEKAIDRESAYEKLQASAEARLSAAEAPVKAPTERPSTGGSVMDVLGDVLLGSTGPRGGRREGMLEAAAKSAARSIGSGMGREVVRGVLGSLLGGRRRR
jgi:hypothetical protein